MLPFTACRTGRQIDRHRLGNFFGYFTVLTNLLVRVSLANLPAGFTTIELKSNHLATASDGAILASAKPTHLGRTTQVWDAVVTHKQSGKTLALFRCTPLILYATNDGAGRGLPTASSIATP